MKPILFVLRNYFITGGSAKVYRELCQRLPSSEIFVLTRGKEGLVHGHPGQYAYKTIPTLGIDGKSKFGLNYIKYLVRFIKELRSIRKEFNFKIVCLENALEIEAILTHLCFQVPIVFYCHGEEFNRDLWSFNWLKRRILYPYFDRNGHFSFIAVSHLTKKLIGSYVGHRALARTAVIPNGVDISKHDLTEADLGQLRSECALTDKFVILTVSRFDKRKGHHLFLPMLKRLLETHSNVVYVTIGEGRCLSQFQDQVRDHGLEGYVRCLGYVSEDVKKMYYQLADIFLLLCYTDDSGTQEGFGLVFLEANAYGIPVIAGNSGGVSDSVSSGESGFVVDPFDQEEVYSRVSQLITDQEEMNRLKASSKQWASRFSWDKMANEFQDFIETVK